VTIHRLLQHPAFNQDDIDRMVAAYEHCLQTLGPAGKSDPVTELIARHVIEIAQTGERDSAVIGMRVLEALQQRPR
jgi:hypothetical protein